MTDELHYLSAAQLLGHFRARTLSPVEVVTAILQRIAAINPKVNAIASLDAEGALQAAREAERRWFHGAPRGQLDGVPITLKDSFPNTQIAVFHGTLAHTSVGDESSGDAPVVARLKEHGAVILATTTMPDWGMIASGLSSRYGITRNPWDLDRNPGGSSSGSGVALASGFGALSVGTDIGGSLRIPSAFCGTFALKPTYGRVPYHDPAPWLVAGPMARSAADCALMMNVITLPDRRDDTALAYEAADYHDGLAKGVSGLRIALLPEIGFGPAIDPQIHAALLDAGRKLQEMGAIVDIAPPIFEADPEPHFDRYVHVDSYLRFARLPAEEQDKLLPLIANWCRRIVTENPVDLMTAMVELGPIRRRIARAFAQIDYILLPTMGMLPYAAHLPWPPNDFGAHNPYCFPFNISEQPAAAFNGGFSREGLPIGLQIVGRRTDDRGVLQVAAACEQLLGLGDARPTFRRS